MKLTRRPYHVFIILFLSILWTDIAYAQLPGYEYRKQYQVNGAQVTGSHSDFPVLFSVTNPDLRSTSNGGFVENVNGFDIAFTSDDGSTQLDHELESYNSATGEVVVWVRFPTLSSGSDTGFFVYFGNSSISSDQSVVTTWDSDFQLVMHLDDFDDATANSNNGTENGNSSILSATGQIGNGRDFERGDRHFISVPDDASLDISGDITMSFWVNLESDEDPDFITKGTNTSYEATSRGNRRPRFRRNGGNNVNSDTNLPIGSWSYLTYVRTSTQRLIYLNGTLDASGNDTGTFSLNNDPLIISRNNDAIDGVMDEVRISDIARSADWIATEFSNQDDPASFITEIPEPPVLANLETDILTFTNGGSAVFVTSALTVSTPFLDSLESATIQITSNYLTSDDTLTFINTSDIIGSWNDGNGTLTLSGRASVSDYQTALRSVRYQNTASPPSLITRTLSFSVDNVFLSSNTETRDLDILITISEPSSDIANVVFHFDALDVDGDLSIIDQPATGTNVVTWGDRSDNEGGSASDYSFTGISSNVPSFEVYDVTKFSSLTFNGTTDVLSRPAETEINGSTFTEKSFAAVFRTGSSTSGLQIIYEQGGASRGYQLSIKDGTAYAYVWNNIEWRGGDQFKSINLGAVEPQSTYIIIASHDATSTTLAQETWSASINGGTITTLINVTDQPGHTDASGIGGINNATLDPVTNGAVSGGNFFEGEVHEFISWNSALGNGAITSLYQYLEEKWINDEPVLSGIEGTNLDFTEGDSPVTVTSTLSVSDPDNDRLDSAKVTIATNFQSGDDVLSFTPSGSITGAFNTTTGVLSLSGFDTEANYETVLRSVTYQNTDEISPLPGIRQLDFAVFDRDSSSNIQSRNVNVLAVNSTPSLSNIEGTALAYTEGDGPVSLTSAITISDLDDTNMEGATIAITGNYIQGEDVLAFTSAFGITSSFNAFTGELTLTGTASIADYQTALRSVTFENNNADPVTLDRTISFTVNDGDTDSNTESRVVTVSIVNSAPVLTNLETSIPTYTGADLQLTNTIEVNDPDDTTIDSAIVVINENLVPAQDSLIYSTIFGITGSYDTSTGRLKLVGNASFSDYETALRSVLYRNISAIPTGPAREVSFIVSDGLLKSDSLQRVIEVTAVEAIPDLKVWLRADVGVDTNASGVVTTWNDQSGNNNDFTGVADIGTAPTFNFSSPDLNGLPSIEFAGNGDHFNDADGGAGYINGMTEFTLFLVYKSDQDNTDRGFWDAETPDGADDVFTIRYDASGANSGGSFQNAIKTGLLGNSAANQLESFSDIQATGRQITSLQWESGTTYDLFVDGILNNPAEAGSPPSGSISGAGNVVVGKGAKDDPDADDRSWDGQIAEVILYCRSLTEEERESVENYLSQKYNSAIRKITAATGGESISADDTNTNYTTLTGPVIQEGFGGELSSSETIVLEAPAGYEWNTSASASVAVVPAYGGSTTLAASVGTITTSQVTINITAASFITPGQITVSGLEIRPTSGSIPNPGTILNTGTTGLGGGTNYGALAIVPGSADSIVVIQQPTDTSLDSVITPSVRAQLVDQFGNEVTQSGTNITVAIDSGTGTLSGTVSVTTNSLGIADFSDLSIDQLGSKTLGFSGTGLDPTVSSSFDVVSLGTLTGFRVERVPSGNISPKTAGQTFSVVLTAIDGTGTTVTGFNGTVVITSNCTIGSGQGTTASFTNGVLASHNVSLTSVGNCALTATNSSGSESGVSNTFIVSPGAADVTTSTISASPTTILNNGTSTSTITVQLLDAFGNQVTSSAGTVTLGTTLGSLGGVTDNTDGTYTAVLTSSTTAGSATITGSLNGAGITDHAIVEFAQFTHVWESQLGSSADATNWDDTDNWDAGTLPGPSSIVLIPSSPAVGNEFPVVDNVGITVAEIVIETGATITISGTSSLEVTGDLTGAGEILGSNVDTLKAGGTIDLADIGVGNVVFNGSAEQDVISPHDYTNLEVDNAVSVRVSENLTVSGSLELTNGDLIIPSGLNLIANNQTYGSGQLRFQRAVSGVRGWRLLSAPVSSTFGDFLDGTLTQGYTGSTLGNAPLDSLQPNVLTYLESFPGTDNQRYRAPSGSADNLTEGQGMFVFFFGDIAADTRYNDPLPDTLDVAGQEFDGNGTFVDYGITYTASADTGWNLVGNPFGATIDWDDNPNWTKTNVESSIYVWDPAANGGNGEYLTWNGITGSLGSGLIAPFQGFWVKASAPSPVLRVNKAAKTTGGNFLRKASPDSDQFPSFGLVAEAGGLKKEINFMFSDNGLIQKDAEDAFRLIPFSANRVDFYSLLPDGTHLDINNLPGQLTNRLRIPLHISAFDNGVPVADTYSISLLNADNLPEDWVLKLIDTQTDNTIELLNQESYSFFHAVQSKMVIADPGSRQKVIGTGRSSADRFVLQITTEEIEANIPQTAFLRQNYPNPFNPETVIEFGLETENSVTLEVFDILGRKVQTLVQERMPAGLHSVTFRAGELASGVYLYRLQAGERVFTNRLTLIK
ncbi:MAG: DUF2341 domain-containing protein [Bacteroidota bacterium]